MRNIIKHIRRSLSWKLSLGIVLMAIPIFLLSLGILYIQSRNYVKKEATDHASSVLSTTMQRIDRYMNTVETASDINDWEVAENLYPDSLLAYTRFIVSLNGNIDGCSISMEPNMFPKIGRYFSAYTVRKNDSIQTVVEEEYEYFEKIWYKTPHLQGKPCWVVYYDDESLEVVLDGMIASYGKPLYDRQKHFIGVISTDLSLIHLSKVISQEKPYPDSYFMMVGEEGRYYIHPDSTMLFTHSIFDDVDPREQTDILALGYEMTNGKQGNMSVVINGESCLVNYQPVAGTNWSLALVCPERSVLQSYNQLSYIVGPLTIIGLLMIFVFSIVSVSNALRPINKLAKKIQRIADGHFDETIKRSRYHDSLGKLQTCFAKMQESLNHHILGVQQMNDEAAQRNEELVRTSELAKEADRQKSLFIQNVSHQVRTPLNIIMGFAQVLRENKSTLSADEASTIIKMMRHNAMTMDRMSKMLFDSSVRGATEETYANRDEEVPCNETARECLRLTQEHQPDHNFHFVTDLPDDFCIHTSLRYLMVTIRELLDNASKHSDGQNILLRVSEIDSMVRFIVEDTGPGIPEENISRLFKPFTKVNDLSEGLGLGLPLVMRHVRNLKGDVFIDTTYHLGCRIIVELPKT